MHARHFITASLLTLCTIASNPTTSGSGPHTPTTQPAPVTGDFAIVPDSAWVDVNGPTLSFYPVVSNEQLEEGEGLATTLDDFSSHLGTAQDSLRGAESPCTACAATLT